VLDLDAQRPAREAGAPEIERRMDGAAKGFGTEGEAGIVGPDAEGFGETAVVAGTGVTGTDAGMKRLDRCRSHRAPAARSVALLQQSAKRFFIIRSG
jgi:hypothetical protein